ncbi:MAG: serine/threonine-protein kinase [Vulcanimicrobiota bacterium]
MTLQSGALLDNRYQLLELLGEGGMGQVFKARHTRLGKIFAVKSLRHLSPDPREQAKYLNAFESEARILAELDHPALARVSDFFEMNGTHFLVMEFIDGKTLARVIELAPRNLSQRRVLQWASELCEVLDYLHSRKPPVIVRDLKPENIMIDSKRRLRLVDFGISKRLKPGEGTHDIVKGMGTAEYAPLEQYGNSTTDQRSDIYALGATLYFLLTEIAPPPAWKRAAEGVEPMAPSLVNPTVTVELEKLLHSMMALRKEDRPQSIGEVQARVRSIPEPRQTPVPPLKQVPPSAVPAGAASAAKVGVSAARVPQPPAYSEGSKRYGMPGAAVPKAKTVVRSTTGRIPNIKVLGCKSLRRYATTPEAVRTCPGKPLLAVAGKYLQVWDLNTEQMTSKFWSGEQSLVTLDFSPDGRNLYAAETEGKIRQFEVDTGKKLKTMGRRSWGLFPDRIRDVCTLPFRDRVVVASDTSNIRIFDTSTGEVSKTLDWHQTGLLSKLGRKTLSLAASRSGLLAAGGADGTLSVYEKGEFKPLFHSKLGQGDLLSLQFSADSAFLAVVDSRGAVLLLKVPTFETVHKLEHPASPRAVSFSHDLRVIATGASDCKIRLFHFNTGKELTSLSHHAGGILDLDFFDSEPTLVSVGNDRRLFITRLTW